MNFLTRRHQQNLLSFGNFFPSSSSKTSIAVRVCHFVGSTYHRVNISIMKLYQNFDGRNDFPEQLRGSFYSPKPASRSGSTKPYNLQLPLSMSFSKIHSLLIISSAPGSFQALLIFTTKNHHFYCCERDMHACKSNERQLIYIEEEEEMAQKSSIRVLSNRIIRR